MAEVAVIPIPRLMPLKEVAAALGGVCERTVERERKRGKLGFVRVGGKKYSTEEQVADYIDQQTVKPCQNETGSEAATGSASTRPVPTGRSRGTTPRPGKPSAGQLAQRTLQRLRSDVQSSG